MCWESSQRHGIVRFHFVTGAACSTPGTRYRRTPARRSWPSSRPLRGVDRQIRTTVPTPRSLGDSGYRVFARWGIGRSTHQILATDSSMPQAVPEPPQHQGDGTCRGVPHARRRAAGPSANTQPVMEMAVTSMIVIRAITTPETATSLVVVNQLSSPAATSGSLETGSHAAAALGTSLWTSTPGS